MFCAMHRAAQGHRAMTAPGKPRQARAIRTRDSVLAAAARVIDRQGLAATRLEEIATEADVTKGALYFHFPSKSEIATAIVEQHHEQCARLALETQNWDLDGVSTLERFINELAMSYQRNAVARAAIRLGIEHERIGAEIREPYADYLGWVQELLVNARDDGTLDSAVDPTTTARIIVGSLFGIQEMSTRLTEFGDLIQRVHEWWSFIRPVLTGPSSQIR